MGSIIENHTDRKEIINLLCILFILGSSFLSYIIPSLKSQIFSIGLTLFGYICFIFTNWILLKRFCLSNILSYMYYQISLFPHSLYKDGIIGDYILHTPLSYFYRSGVTWFNPNKKENIFRSY